MNIEGEPFEGTAPLFCAAGQVAAARRSLKAAWILGWSLWSRSRVGEGADGFG